jgi:hypothetical protein
VAVSYKYGDGPAGSGARKLVICSVELCHDSFVINIHYDGVGFY